MDRQTIEIYDAKAADYAKLITSDAPSRHLRAFMEALPKGGHALDLGCGPGNAAATMRDAGFRVTALDASAKMVELGKERYGLDITLGTFDDVIQTAEYDGIWASFSLLHAPRDHIPRHLTAIHTALKPQGIFVIGVKTGTGTERDSLGRQYTYFEPAELDALLRAAGFTPTSSATGSDTGLAGDISPWIIVTAHA
ncbi:MULTISPECIES: class I SAM-dependent methyltransferase [Rhodobacterales]|uniref:class I SAM-dependent DNA methyltransferase n=1 Tax=Roseobacter sp. N2S TaxID=2663844 RepID=UPI0028547AB8|nr:MULTISPECIES: class I SAM-dependent methyltransferase [Rhodobacterales]MDR6267218.1 SAM-dependent methyltransferase [Roseobacter sp. N2S]